MKFNATLNLGREELREVVVDAVNRQGYMPEGELSWTDEGATIDVRPMTDEEKEEYNVSDANVADEVTDAITNVIEEQHKQTCKMLNEYFGNKLDKIQGKLEEGVYVEEKENTSSKESNTKPASKKSSNVIAGIDLTTYGLDPEEDDIDEERISHMSERSAKDYLTSLSRKKRIKKEVSQAPDLYGDNVKDEEGYVVLGRGNRG